jgi:hypothetical protein
MMVGPVDAMAAAGLREIERGRERAESRGRKEFDVRRGSEAVRRAGDGRRQRSSLVERAQKLHSWVDRGGDSRKLVEREKEFARDGEFRLGRILHFSQWYSALPATSPPLFARVS